MMRVVPLSRPHEYVGPRLSAIVAHAAFLAVLSLATTGFAADPEPSPSAIDEARGHFAEGSAHYQAKRYAEALASLGRSYKLVESPNTELLLARSMRALGRGGEALASFEHAEADARRRVAQGETKYAPTADAAAQEASKLRSELGTVKIHVARPSGSAVQVNGRPLALSPSGDATVVHEPGTISVVFREASGAVQRQSVTVLAGSSVQLDFAGEAVPPPGALNDPPPPVEDKPSGGTPWTVPAAWVAGGVTLAGLGTFIGFGLSSQSTYDDLVKRCGPADCGAAERAEAESGRGAQTLANVGLGVGIVAAVATTVFVVLSLTSRSSMMSR
jgi:hypothetical protein